MPSITLYEYLDQLQTLLNREAYDEVVGHAHHILQHYPRNIATYQILGKALLRTRNYKEAGEVFQRLLSANPADVDAHVGLSEVYEIQKEIESAIWHMQRAWESAPENTPIRDNLLRLFEKRDGERPEQLKLTRSALARQYIRGNLYDQAIGELRSALEKTPDRVDLQVLMAQALFAGRYFSDAGETALEILGRLPYCLPVNELMVRLWLSLKRPEDARPFLERVEELAPYLSVELIAGEVDPKNAAFLLPRLDWSAASSAAIAASMPDWMSDLEMDMSGTGSSSTVGETSEDYNLDDLPGFAHPVKEKAPDWFPEGVDFAKPATDATGPLSAPEDWFNEMMTTSAASAPTPEPPAAADFDWFNTIQQAPAAPAGAGDLPLPDEFGAVFGEDQAPSIPVPATGDLDWMADFGADQSTPMADSDFEMPDMGDILSGKSEPEPTSYGMTDLLSEIALEEAQFGQTRELASSEVEKAQSLTGLFDDDNEEDLFNENTPAERAQGLTGLFGSEEQTDATEIQRTSREQGLTGLFGQTEALPDLEEKTSREQGLTGLFGETESSDNEEMPHERSVGLTQLFKDDSVESAQSEPATPATGKLMPPGTNWLKTPVEFLDQQEEVDAAALAWLGTPAEELEADEEAEIPDWMRAPQTSAQVEEAEETPAAGETPQWLADFQEKSATLLAELPQDDDPLFEEESDWMDTENEDEASALAGETPDWLSTAAPIAAHQAEEESPQWLAESGEESAWLSEAVPLTEAATAQPAEEAEFDWLDAIDMEETAGSEEAPPPPQPAHSFEGLDWADDADLLEEAEPTLAAAETPDWLSEAAPAAVQAQAAGETPDWLSEDLGTAGESDWFTEEAEPTLAAAETPNWLSEAAPAPAIQAQAADETPDWLSEDLGTAGESDWFTEEAEPTLAAAETPDWLSEAAPAAVQAQAADETPDWLSEDLGTAGESDWFTEEAEPTLAAAETPDWLSEAAPAPAIQAQAADETPDWMNEDLGAAGESDWFAEEAEPTLAAAETPDWLSEAAPAPAVQAQAADETPDWLSEDLGAAGESDWFTEEAEPTLAAAETPDWLSEAAPALAVQAQAADKTPDWMSEDISTEDEGDWFTEEAEPTLAAGETPDWLSEAAPAPAVQAQAADETPDWLSEDLGTAGESDWFTEEAEPTLAAAETPDWLSEAAPAPAVQAQEMETDLGWLEETGEAADWGSTFETTAEAEPAAVADAEDWFSSPQAFETLDAKTDEAPAWAESAEPQEASASFGSDLGWLDETEAAAEFEAQESFASEEAEIIAGEEETPDWLRNIQQTRAVAEEPEAPAPAIMQEDIEIEPVAYPSWMAAFTGEDLPEEKAGEATEVDHFLADFLDPDAAAIAAQRSKVAEPDDMADNREKIKPQTNEEETAFSFDFDFSFDKPPAWMRGAARDQESGSSFRPAWMRDDTDEGE